MTTKLIGVARRALRNLFGRPAAPVGPVSEAGVSHPDFRGNGSADHLTVENDDPARDQDTASPQAALESGASRLDPDTGKPELADSESQRLGAQGLIEKPHRPSEMGRIGAEDYPDEGYPDGGYPDERSTT